MKVGPSEKYPKDRLVLRDHPSKKIFPKKLSTNTLTRYSKNIWAGNQPDNPLAEPKHRLEEKGNTGF
jgi:hypothetical protein